MALAVPTTQDISDNIVAQLEGSLAQTIPLLPKAVLRVVAKVMAGVFILLWKYCGWIFLQQFPAFATMKETTINGTVVRPLVEHGRRAGLRDPENAVQAELTITVTVENQTGSLAAGAQLVRRVTQVVYQTQGAVSLNAATVTVTVKAVAGPDPENETGAGEIGNLAAGDVLEFANPLPNVAREATVLSLDVIGADAETEEEYRAVVLEKERARLQGGAYSDFRDWAKSVSGVVNAYPYTGLPGEVDVYVEVDVDVDPDGIPDTPTLNAVLAAINLNVGGKASRRPINAAPNALPITREPIDVIVRGLDVPADALAVVQAAISAGCDEHLRSRAPFISGLSVLPRTDRITRAELGGIVAQIVASYGGTITAVDLEQSGVEITAYTLGDGQKAKLGEPFYP